MWLVATMPPSLMTIERPYERSCAESGEATMSSNINKAWARDISGFSEVDFMGDEFMSNEL